MAAKNKSDEPAYDIEAFLRQAEFEHGQWLAALASERLKPGYKNHDCRDAGWSRQLRSTRACAATKL